MQHHRSVARRSSSTRPRAFAPRLALLCAALAAAAACGAGAPPADPGDASTEASPPAPDAASERSADGAFDLPAMPQDLPHPPADWDSLSAGDRARYMATAVMPTMEALFRAYDATRFARPSCATCHGPDAEAVNFRMPHDLPALPAFGTPAQRAQMQRDPRLYAFMQERVSPAMARLLGEAPYDPRTHAGFGCFDCHPQADH